MALLLYLVSIGNREWGRASVATGGAEQGGPLRITVEIGEEVLAASLRHVERAELGLLDAPCADPASQFGASSEGHR